ncbi:MAG: DUF1993 domain-containing protein [Gammaproteobacteria bacterium]|nr:DUF1993 domain-containing protein [Gammaproteobacteria bacterium]MBQ0839239.1 DUF1993 domain-containing protein [Gammaproteobacteria bacterium]
MTDLYELSIDTYKRVLASTIDVMEKGATYFNEQGLDLADLVNMQLAPDMRAFPFQVSLVRHQSLGAAKGIVAGEFSPPPEIPELDYRGLINLLSEALVEVNNIKAETINGVAGKAMYFRKGDFELPFTTENFILSFSLPNLYFHAATIYDMLRIKGVPLGKMDYMGKMKVGLPGA